MGRQEGGAGGTEQRCLSQRSPKPAKFGEGLPLPQHGRPDTPSAPIATFPLPPNPAGFGADLELTPAQLTDY